MYRTRSWLPFLVRVAGALSCADHLTGPRAEPPEGRVATAVRDEGDPTAIDFARLAPGDALVVDIDVRGCFNHDTYHLVFEAGPAGVLAVAGTRASQMVAPEQTPAVQRLATRWLSTREIEGLERLLAYYRAGPGEGCTSRHTARLRLVRDGVTLREEAYADGSCGLPDDQRIVSFFALVSDQVVDFQRAAG